MPTCDIVVVGCVGVALLVIRVHGRQPPNLDLACVLEDVLGHLAEEERALGVPHSHVLISAGGRKLVNVMGWEKVRSGSRGCKRTCDRKVIGENGSYVNLVELDSRKNYYWSIFSHHVKLY